MRRTAKVVLILFVLLPVLASGMLHPMKKPLTTEQVAYVDGMLRPINATREEFEVVADDNAILRGWKVRAPQANGDWALLYHGVSDNRTGVTGHAEFLLRNGYSVVMMDARAHGASGGEMATYGWIERRDTQAILDAVFTGEKVHCLFLLGESMGASIALQSAALDKRVEGVVAEAAFANLKEVSFDYAGLRMSHWLGRTIFRPASSVALKGAEKEGGFKAEDVSPERAVAERAFPVLLIAGAKDRNVPARHSKRIYEAASGPKELWVVRGADHTAALGTEPEEFEQRVVKFYRGIHKQKAATPSP